MSEKMLHCDKSAGERLKRLAKEHGYTREKLADTVSYAPGSISRFYNNESEIPGYVAKKLSEEWNIREEYILFKDNFETEEDLFQYVNNKDLEEMQAAIKYLESLGLILKPRNILQIYLWPVYKIINGYYDVDLEDFVKEQDIEDLKEKYDFSLSEEEFKGVYQLDAWKESTLQKPEFCYLELSAPVPASFSFELLTNGNYSKDSANGCYPIAPKDNPFHTILGVDVFFDAYYKGDLKQRIGVSKLQKFIKTLDLHTKISIENNLLDGEPGDMYMPLSAFNE